MTDRNLVTTTNSNSQ